MQSLRKRFERVHEVLLDPEQRAGFGVFVLSAPKLECQTCFAERNGATFSSLGALVLVALAVAFVATGCGSGERKEPRAPEAETPPAPTAPPPAPTPGPCVRAAGTCFQSFDEACEALQCPQARCVKQSYPAEVRCSDEPIPPDPIPKSLEP